jgi:phage shock protein PspC (stress-responsive transcriptional regulator)
MIQSIKINLNKTTFTLDNNAYEKLNAYMFELKNSFKNDSDIVLDIEARLAELLTLQLAATNDEVVNESHVINALNTIGSVQELLKSYNFETGNSNDFTNNNFNNNEKPLLRRNPFNQSLGGVCSGIANYLNTDTSLVRIAFVFAFFIIGSGLLIYLILWIVIPKATGELAGKLNKRENNNPNKLMDKNTFQK